MRYLKIITTLLSIFILLNICGSFYLYKEISKINRSVSSLETAVYYSDDDKPNDEIESKISDIESEMSGIKNDLREVRIKANDAEIKGENAEDKFHALCMIHNVCDI